ncbi:MAG: DUF4825 domain-containing protein [Clostridium sp.]
MRCNENKIIDFIDDNLTEKKALEVEEHLKQCKHCMGIYNRLMTLENLEKDKEVYNVNLSGKIMASLGENIYAEDKQYVLKRTFNNHRKSFFKYAAVALLAVVITTGVVIGGNGELFSYLKGINKGGIEAVNNGKETKPESKPGEGTDKANTQVINIGDLLKYKGTYVGDNSAVGGILSSLPGSKFIEEFSLKTDKEPYGIEVNYKPGNTEKSKEEFARIFNEKTTKNIFVDNAITLFILVKNVDEVKFNLNSDGETSFSITRQEVENFYGRDMREYAGDKALWEVEIANSKSRPRQDVVYPTIHINSEGKEIPWARGNANYVGAPDKFVGNTNFADVEAWNELIPVVVKPNAVINFKADEVEGLNVPIYKVYSSDEKVISHNEYPSNNGSMKAPAEEGNYYFAIFSEWGRGDNNIEYLIKIKVEK